MYLLLIIKTIILVLIFSLYENKITFYEMLIFLLLGDVITIIINKTNYLKLILICGLIYYIYTLYLKYNKVSKEYIIIENGVLKFNELIKNKIDLKNVLKKLKKLGIRSIEEIEKCVIKNNELKINQIEYPYPIIVNGVINYNGLFKINKNKKWLNNFLDQKHLTLNQIYYAFHLENKTYILTK